MLRASHRRAASTPASNLLLAPSSCISREMVRRRCRTETPTSRADVSSVQPEASSSRIRLSCWVISISGLARRPRTATATPRRPARPDGTGRENRTTSPGWRTISAPRRLLAGSTGTTATLQSMMIIRSMCWVVTRTLAPAHHQLAQVGPVELVVEHRGLVDQPHLDPAPDAALVQRAAGLQRLPALRAAGLDRIDRGAGEEGQFLQPLPDGVHVLDPLDAVVVRLVATRDAANSRSSSLINDRVSEARR